MAGRVAGPAQADQLLGMGYRQTAQQRLIEQCEDRRVGADAQRQRQYGDGGEDRGLAHLPQAKSKFLKNQSA